MTRRSLSEIRRAFYASNVPITDRTQAQGSRPNTPVGSIARTAGAKTQTMASASGAIDHWSAIFFYSMGFGAVAVGILLFAVFLMVSLYGQFVWTFTQWDGVNIRLAPFRSLACLILS